MNKKLSDLIPDHANANKGTQRGRAALESSLRRYGAGRSILVDRNGRIIAGNKTAEIASDIGMDNVIVVQTDGTQIIAVQRTDLDIDSETGRGLAYADNRVGELSLDWDAEQVLADLDAGVNLSGLFDKEELDELLSGLKSNDDIADAEPQIDRAEELRQKWGVESGQLWQLGEHRLICGDCTDAAVVARLMAGEQARLCFTSPPYADQREYTIGKFDWLALANGFTSCVFGILGDPADFVVNLGISYKDGRCNFYWNDWLTFCEGLGHPLYGWYVWDKGEGMPGEWNGRLAPAHEWLFHFSIGRRSARKWIETKGLSGPRQNKRFRQSDGTLKKETSPELFGQAFKVPNSVVRIFREKRRGIHTQTHPAVFSVELPEFATQTWSDANSIVYEPFSGSGTTIIACENLRRRCRAVEIAPGYVAVALERWHVATGKMPARL